MKTFPVLLFLSVSALAQSLPDPVSNTGREIVFVDATILPMDRERVVEHQTVVTRDGLIVAIGGAGDVQYDRNALVINASGRYLMPGLAEMHAHVPPVDDLEPMKEVLTLFAVNGITTIRGMLGHPRHLELRGLINTGKIVAPHFYTTGPSFNGISVTSPEAGAAMVRRQKQAGYDFLKLHPGLTRAEFDSIADAAKKAGIPFAGHVSFGVGVWRAIEAGYSSIDHLDGFIEGLVPGIDKMTQQQTGFFGSLVADRADTTQIPRLMEALKKNNIWVVPTQSLAERWISARYTAADFESDPARVYMSPAIVRQWLETKNATMTQADFDAARTDRFVSLRRRLIKACQDHGVGLLLGCDAPQVFNVPGFSTHNELEYLVQSGLTPYEAIRTGTVNVGRYLDRDSGVLRSGAISDLILLNANPLEDISHTRDIAGVMIGDKWLDRTYIDSALENLAKR